MTVDSAAWSAGAAGLAAVLTWTVARRTADASVSAAWVEYLKPVREDLATLRAEVRTLTAENAALAARLEAAQRELADLRQLERASTIRSTTDAAVLKTSLAGAGIDVPDVSPRSPLERTRIGDAHEQ